MTKEKYIKILKLFLLLIGIFIVADALFHFTGIRSHNIEKITSPEIKSFIDLFIYLWASAALLLGLIVLKIRINPAKYVSILDLFTFFSIWHGLLLISLSFNKYENILPLKSMYMWHPYYTIQLIFEGGSLLLFSLFYLFGRRKKIIS